METIKFGLSLTVIPFIVIIQVITIWWALVDIAVRKIKGTERTLWTILIVLIPPIGSLIYNALTKANEKSRPPAHASSERG